MQNWTLPYTWNNIFQGQKSHRVFIVFFGGRGGNGKVMLFLEIKGHVWKIKIFWTIIYLKKVHEYNNQLCSDRRTASMTKLHWTLQTVHPNSFIASVFRHQWLLPFHTAFTDLDCVYGSHGEHKAKPVGFIFSHTFHLIRMKFHVMKQFNCFWVRFIETRE